MKRLLAAFLLLSCRSEEPYPYLHDPGYRRRALIASVNADTAYGRARLQHYDEWSALPEDGGGIAVPATLDRDSLVALGKVAFRRYPAQGRFTCASCHSYRGEDGVPNRDLDVGALLIAEHPAAPAAARAIALSWGPGRVDVTTADGSEPARIPDLRPVRFLRHLQWSGAVRQNDVTSLALRIETLIVSARNYAARPPRAIALGLALYVWSLADRLPMTEPPPPFVRACGSCHEGPGLAGGLVDADEVGTDTALARSKDRGTGFYRVPSLRGVGSRGPLMHDGSIASVDQILDRHGPSLEPEERTAIARFLHAL